MLFQRLVDLRSRGLAGARLGDDHDVPPNEPLPIMTKRLSDDSFYTITHNRPGGDLSRDRQSQAGMVKIVSGIIYGKQQVTTAMVASDDRLKHLGA